LPLGGKRRGDRCSPLAFGAHGSWSWSSGKQEKACPCPSPVPLSCRFHSYLLTTDTCTPTDYLHLTKRFAQVAASLLPLHYLLGTSSRLSPLPFLFRLSSGGASTKYNAYHRLNGALLLGLLACHASLYLNFYIQKGLLVKRAQDLDVQMGLGMAGTLAVLGFFAREAVRKSWRGAFVLTHVAGAGLVVLMLFFHASAARWYAVEAGIVYVAVLYEKLVRAQRRTKRAG
jgi:hypothetical protein